MKAIWNDQVIAESDQTIVVESNHYFPADSINKEYIQESGTTTICPCKGEARYYSLSVKGEINQECRVVLSGNKGKSESYKRYGRFLAWRAGS